jgi:hypothetical protein
VISHDHRTGQQHQPGENTIMNSNDERDYAEEAFNREILETGDGEAPAGITSQGRAVMTSGIRPEFPAPGAYEGYVQFADGTLLSLQCHESRCGDCPASHGNPDDGSTPLRTPYGNRNCEHSCNGTIPAAGPSYADLLEFARSVASTEPSPAGYRHDGDIIDDLACAAQALLSGSGGTGSTA